MADKTKETPAESGKTMVRYKLDRIPGVDSEKEHFVSVNGESYLIRRGVEVSIPDYVAEVLDRAKAENEKAEIDAENRQELAIEPVKRI